MAYRILADENVERATVNYLRKTGHDVKRLNDVAELELGAGDELIARYAREHDRLILTQDDFFTERDVEDTAGVLFQRDQTLSTREVGERRSRDVAVPQPVRRNPRIRQQELAMKREKTCSPRLKTPLDSSAVQIQTQNSH